MDFRPDAPVLLYTGSQGRADLSAALFLPGTERLRARNAHILALICDHGLGIVYS